MREYDIALICLNGHVINSMLRASPEPGGTTKFCQECGSETVSTCPNCHTDIRGHELGTLVFYYAPKYCHNCGAPYFWTKKRIDALKQIASEEEKLSKEEREQLSLAIDDLIKDTPATDLAALRFKRLVAKISKEGWEAMKSILIDIATEAAKGKLGLS